MRQIARPKPLTRNCPRCKYLTTRPARLSLLRSGANELMELSMSSSAALQLLLSRVNRPLRLIDIGARWGAVSAWDSIASKSEILCFEPDATEAARLNADAPPNVRYLPLALGKTDGDLDINVTRQPACSSVYSPIPSLYENYPDLADTTPVKVERVPCRTLDGVLSELQIEAADCIKIDTQGSELDILKGAVATLKGCTMLDVELIFNPLYAGQPLFCDIDRYMRDQGFTLWRISDLVHYATEPDPASPLNFMLAHSPPQQIQNHPVPGGQLFWGDAQYVRSEFPRTGDGLPQNRAVPAAAVVANAGFWDLSLEILRKCDPAFSKSVRTALAS